MRSFQSSGVSAITGRILPLDEDDLFSRARQLRYDMRRREALMHERPVEFSAGGNSAIRRFSFDRIGGFDPEFVMMHDRELVLRMKRERMLCYYIDDLEIAHHHHKGLAPMVRGTISSGYYRLLLEQQHPDLGQWSLRSYISSLRSLARSVRSFQRSLLPALIASAMESTHAAAYIWFRVTSKIPLPPRGYDL